MFKNYFEYESFFFQDKIWQNQRVSGGCARSLNTWRSFSTTVNGKNAQKCHCTVLAEIDVKIVTAWELLPKYCVIIFSSLRLWYISQSKSLWNIRVFLLTTWPSTLFREFLPSFESQFLILSETGKQAMHCRNMSTENWKNYSLFLTFPACF